jgi:hypothetical protein
LYLEFLKNINGTKIHSPTAHFADTKKVESNVLWRDVLFVQFSLLSEGADGGFSEAGNRGTTLLLANHFEVAVPFVERNGLSACKASNRNNHDSTIKTIEKFINFNFK